MLFSCLGSDYCAMHPNVSLLDIFLAIMGILLLLFVVIFLAIMGILLLLFVVLILLK
jgi:hypothetical protein